MKFNDLGLTESLLSAVSESGYTTPTPIQAQAIPAILSGKDVMAAAQTGTGKTAGFTLPLLQLMGGKTPTRSGAPTVLVLTPTRELAAQVLESIQTYGRNERLTAGVVFGGVNINPQLRLLKRGVDILVATPGRLLDLHQQKAVRFDSIEILVLDEADRMLDMGFIHDIKRILKMLPSQRQNLMFSATFSPEIRSLAKTICRNPLEIDVAPRNSTVAAISQGQYAVEKQDKIALLSKLLHETGEQVLVFSRTKHGANKLARCLQKDSISAEAIHGNKSQSQRTRALSDFKANRVQVLVATDIAARGLDIDQLGMVINFDMPHVPEDYIHRIGRTGRAGASGRAVSLVSSEEVKQLRAIERLIGKSIERLTVTGGIPRASSDSRTTEDSDARARTDTRTRSGNGARSGAETELRNNAGAGARNGGRNDSRTRSQSRSGAGRRSHPSAGSGSQQAGRQSRFSDDAGSAAKPARRRRRSRKPANGSTHQQAVSGNRDAANEPVRGSESRSGSKWSSWKSIKARFAS